MADCQHRAIIGGERRFESGNAIEIEVIGGLVEDQQLGRRRCRQSTSERGAQAFAAAQFARLAQCATRVGNTNYSFAIALL